MSADPNVAAVEAVLGVPGISAQRTEPRIDHENEALISVEQAWQADEPRTRELWIAQSAVHASLALAEQQRIANLIEVSRQRQSEEQQSKSGRTRFADHTGRLLTPEQMHLRTAEAADLVREGLGLS